MNKLILGLVVSGIVILGTTYFLFLNNNTREVVNDQVVPSASPQTSQQQEKVGFTAKFLIFTNGTERIFTDPRYHNLNPDVFLTAENPGVIHVKKENITWDEFFKTLPMELKKDCLVTGTKQMFCSNETQKLKFYLNGTLDDNALDKEIKPNDKLLVSYGSENNEQIKKQLQKLNL